MIQWSDFDTLRESLPAPAFGATMPAVSPYRVIFVCMGNICRSPMAELVFRQQLELAGLAGQVVADSAGTGDWHIGDPADRRARAALERRGYPTEHRARQFETTWFAERELVIALDRDNARQLKRLAPTREISDAVRLLRQFDTNAEAVDIPDPYYGDAAGFDEALDQIEPSCAGLLEHLAIELKAPAPMAQINSLAKHP